MQTCSVCRLVRLLCSQEANLGKSHPSKSQCIPDLEIPQRRYFSSSRACSDAPQSGGSGGTNRAWLRAGLRPPPANLPLHFSAPIVRELPRVPSVGQRAPRFAPFELGSSAA